MRSLVILLSLTTFSNVPLAQTAKPSELAPAASLQRVVSPSNRDTDWRPTSPEVELVRVATIAYFTARDEGRLAEAYAKFAPSQKAMVPFEAWRASMEAFNAQAGPVTGRSLRMVTWYKDPPQGRPGVYAAVDFHSDFANLALHCGYIMWQEQSDGSFAVVREEDNVIDKATEAKLKPGDLERIRAQFRC